MTPPGPHATAGGETGSTAALRRDAARDIAAAAVLMLALALALALAFAGPRFGPDYALKSLLLFAAAATLVWCGLFGGATAAGAAPHPHARFGAANRVTLARLGLATLLAALAGETVPGPAASATAAWIVVVAATVTAVLDAVDGWFARRDGLASAFGARFDMETDAAFTLVLCLLVLQAGQAGPWVLAAGLLRYVFVAAARPWPWLGGRLPPSRRRQAACVVQITVLIVCLGPVVPPALASALAAAGLALLTASFAIDVQTLARARQAIPEHRP